jgi:uncharacterized protein involved in outer membrane biogenesis
MRKLIIAVVIVLVIGAGLALAVRTLLSPEMLRSTIESQVASALERPVQIGAARAHVFPSPRVTLSNVSIGGSQTLTADQIIVGAGLKALFQRRVEEAVVRVRNGRIALNAGSPAAADSSTRPADRPTPRPQTPAPRAAGGQRASATASSPTGGFTIASVAEIRFENVVVSGGGKELRLDMEGSLNGDALDVTRLAARSGQTELSAKGKLTSLERVEGAFDVNSPLVDVDEVLAVLAALIPPDPSARGTSGLANADPEGFQFGHITASAAVEKARALGYQISKLTALLDLQGTVLKADKLAFELYGGHYESVLALDLASNKTTIDHRGRLAGANVAQLAALFGQPGLATGKLGLSMRVRGTGRDFATAAEGVSGNADVTLTTGSLKGLDVVRQTFQLLGTAPPPNAGDRFDSLTAQLALAGGAMSADKLVLHSPDFDLKGQANVSPSGALSGRAEMTLSDALSKEAQSRNSDLKLLFEDGRITLPATLSGTLQQPTVLPDLESALKRAARNKINSEIDKAKKRATGELQKGLERLFKRP